MAPNPTVKNIRELVGKVLADIPEPPEDPKEK